MAKYIKTEEGYKTIESIENAAMVDMVKTVDRKMDAANPVGTGSFSMNRKVGSPIGNYSVAEGYNTEASDSYSHAEGYATVASGISSHAEGYATVASDSYSHAEGYATVASGISSHAEGFSTGASGSYSHAEGYATLSSSLYQHVQGKYNVEDTKNIYAHIVGNGTSNTARSNAHTIDWDGNVWFAGDIRVGGSSYSDSNAKVIATQEYVDNNKPTVDDTLSSTSTNAVQNRVVNTAISNLNTLVGDTNVSTQISNYAAPKSHASTETTYGIGTDSNYGHVKLSDSTNSTSAASNGIAASSAAVKSAYDLANTAKTTADNAMPKSGGKFTGDITMGSGTNVVLSDGTNIGAELYNISTVANAAMPKSGGDFTGDVNFSVGGKKVWISFTDENGNPTTEPYIHWEE